MAKANIVNKKYVNIVGNSGIWEFIDFSDHDPNIGVFRNLNNNAVGRFAFFSNGNQKIYPATDDQIQKEVGNVTATISDDVVQLSDKRPEPIKKTTTKGKKRGRPRKRGNK